MDSGRSPTKTIPDPDPEICVHGNDRWFISIFVHAVGCHISLDKHREFAQFSCYTQWNAQENSFIADVVREGLYDRVTGTSGPG